MQNQLNLELSLSPRSETLKDPDYQKIISIINLMQTRGILAQATGHCVSVSEMLQHSLRQVGIESRLIECQMMSSRIIEGEIRDLRFVGYDGMGHFAQLTTHVAVVTETQHPYLVDLTISPSLPLGRMWVCEQMNQGPHYLSQFQFDDITITYTTKTNPILPELHDMNIVERVTRDRTIMQSFNLLKIAIWVIAVVNLINLALNLSILITQHH